MKNIKNYKQRFLLFCIPLIVAACNQGTATSKDAAEKIPASSGTQASANANGKNGQAAEKGKAEYVHPVSDQPVYALLLPGELKPYEEVVIFPKVKGFVKKVFADLGTKVKKGQLLALLEAPEVAQRYVSARSDEQKAQEDYLYSRQSYERLKKAAAKSGAVAAIELDKSFSKLKSDSAAYAAVRSNTRISDQLQQYLSIRAPFDGTVMERHVSVGALVGENGAAPLFSIVQNNKLRLTVAIPEKHSQSLSTTTRVSFTVSGIPGKVFHAVLSRKGDFLQQKSRSVTAEFDVLNKGQLLGGGEYAQVNLELRRPEATFWLPPTSIVQAQSGLFVNKIADGLVKRIPVVLGIRKGALQEVFGAISTNDQILKKGSEEWKDGDKL